MLLDKRTAKANGIVQAAVLLFGKKGYAFTSVEEIAAAAGVGKSTVYDYYKNKEALFKAAVISAAERKLSDLKAITSSTDDPLERMKRITEMYLASDRSECSGLSKLFVEVLSQTQLQGGVFFNQRHMIQKVYQRMIRTVLDLLLEGVSMRKLRPDIARHAEMITINFFAFLDGLTMQSMIAGDHIDMREQAGLYLEQLKDILLPGQGIGT
ncbi:MAG: helix-turn-helix transcriptional regulator [Desulfatitalea sp.]|nr:TetR/AcrR family transcriptional regulator; helix-turn-helix transcriptional regulator [Desulfatitalea sp.]NNK00678.1 helix-turn-helix transcriptional regulator [Desulfatitalea sp.]